MSLNTIVTSPLLQSAFQSCLPAALTKASNLNELGMQAWACRKLRTDHQYERVEALLTEQVEQYCYATFNKPLSTLLEELANQPHGISPENDLLYDILSGDYELVDVLFQRFIAKQHVALDGKPAELEQFMTFWELH